METEFNLQTFLSEMRAEIRNDQEQARKEQRRRHRALSRKVDTCLETLVVYDKRITTVEGTRRVMIWLSGTAFVAFCGAIADFFISHVPTLFTKH